jgi:hemoglobin
MSDDTTPPARTPSERLGGAAVIRTAVDELYRRVVDDPELSPYFASADLAEIKDHQVRLLGSVLGGPQVYGGRALGAAHRGLGITDRHYDRVVAHLTAVLEEAGADDGAVAAVDEAIARVRPDIVEVPAGG